MAKWIEDRYPEDEETVEVKTAGGIVRAWWKGVGWKTGPGEWLGDDKVIGWRPLAT